MVALKPKRSEGDIGSQKPGKSLRYWPPMPHMRVAESDDKHDKQHAVRGANDRHCRGLPERVFEWHRQKKEDEERNALRKHDSPKQFHQWGSTRFDVVASPWVSLIACPRVVHILVASHDPDLLIDLKHRVVFLVIHKHLFHALGFDARQSGPP